METRLLLSFIASLISSFALAAPMDSKTNDFTINAPASWVLDETDGSKIQVYRNTKPKTYERITTQVLDVRGPNLKFESELLKHRQQISDLREAYFARFGLSSYNILAIESRPNQFLSVKGQKRVGTGKIQVIQARFRDFENHETQTLERQYAYGKKLLVVTYILKAPALNDIERAERLLDAFIPNYERDRAPASELVDATSSPQNVRTTEEVTSAVPDIENLNMDDPAIKAMCSSVPDGERRTNADLGFTYALPNFLKNTWGCMSGVGENLWSMVKGVGTLTVAAAKYLNPFSNEYADQVTASLGVVGSEIKNDPKGFVRRLGTQIYFAAAKEMREFPCYKPAYQWQKICSIASNLIPAGLVMKVAAKVPLAAAESVKLAAAVHDGLELKNAAVLADGAKTTPELLAPATQVADTVKAIPPSASVPSIPAVPSTSPKTSVPSVVSTDTIASAAVLKNYSDLLKPLGASKNKIAGLIEKLEKRGISREKIRETIQSVQPLCAVH